MIGTFGPVTFEASDQRVRTFDQMRRKASGRWATHDTVNGAPLLEYIGPDLDEMQFVMQFNAALGVVPDDEIERLQRMARDGEYHVMIVGGIPRGTYAIMSVEADWYSVGAKGQLVSALATIQLREYRELFDA